MTYDGHSDNINAIVWSPDSKLLASVSDDGTMQVWNAATGNEIFTYGDQSLRIKTVAWSPNGKYVASGSFLMNIMNTDKRSQNGMKIWDTATWNNISTYLVFFGIVPVNLVMWASDSTRIVSASGAIVDVWNITAGEVLPIVSYKGHKAVDLIGLSTPYVSTIAWSPDGMRIASGSMDEAVQIWNTFTGDVLLTYEGHSDSVNAVAWSPDGTHIASASQDKSVQIWNAITGALQFTYHSHSTGVKALAWSPDGTRIGSASYRVQVWQAV